MRGVGTAHGRSLFTAMTPGPCRNRRRRSFAEVGFRDSSAVAPLRTLRSSRTFALNPTGSASQGGAADAGKLASMNGLSAVVRVVLFQGLPGRDVFGRVDAGDFKAFHSACVERLDDRPERRMYVAIKNDATVGP